MRTIYLAGPILGCTKGEANDWRDAFSASLKRSGLVGVSPLRCEPLIGDRYTMQYADPRFGTARAISAKNRLDVRMADMTLCYFPDGYPFSKGTLVELAWANAYEKPTILVTTDKSIADHPVVQACASWVVESLDDAHDILVGVLAVYVPPRDGEEWQH